MKAALLQICSSDDPEQNIPVVTAMMRDAAHAGAQFIQTPEVTNCVSMDRAHHRSVLRHEADDPTLAALRDEARNLGVWLSIGSLALRTDDPDGRFANRSFLISSDGDIVARYDKIHMFDVQVNTQETYRESAGFRAGDRAVLADTPFGKVGLTICYDLRFPQLHRALAKAGADILLSPAAFTPVTGVAHWEPLLRARAIETGCFVLAAGQTGTHAATTENSRTTYGHSLVVSPWGEVLADAGTGIGITIVDLDLAEVAQARQRIPALSHDASFSDPDE